MPEFIPVISKEEIETRIRDVGQKISKDYQNKDLVLVGILKGAFIFLSDLTRQITIDHTIDLIGASSYEGTRSTGRVVFTKQPDIDLEGKDILLVEDIVDTGRTLNKIIEFTRLLNARSVKICTLIDKQAGREVKIDIDYSCFSLDKGFIVGYGLDYNEKYRNLPAIYDLIL